MTANHLKDKVQLCISSVQFSCSVVSDSLQPYELQHARPPCPSPTPRAYSNSCPLSQWCHPTSVVPFSSRLQSFPASGSFQMSHPLLLLPSIRVFSNESALCIRSPKYWSFSFSISPSNEPPGLISFRMDWLDLLAVQGTLKSLLQHHSWKASILWRSAFFIVQLSHPYMTTGKTIALTRWTFVSKVMSLLLNMLSWLVITSLPRSKHLNFMAAVTICSDWSPPPPKGLLNRFPCWALPILLALASASLAHASSALARENYLHLSKSCHGFSCRCATVQNALSYPPCKFICESPWWNRAACHQGHPLWDIVWAKANLHLYLSSYGNWSLVVLVVCIVLIHSFIL